MKYLIIGITILALILSLCLLFSYLSNQYLDDVKTQLHDAATFLPVKDWDALVIYTEDAEECWDNHRDFFSSLLDHQELEDIDRTFVSLLAYAKTEEPVGYYEAYKRLLSMLEHISNMDTPHLYNILASIVNHKSI